MWLKSSGLDLLENNKPINVKGNYHGLTTE